MLNPLCDVELWSWPETLKVKLRNSTLSQVWEGWLTWNEMDVSRWVVWPTIWPWHLTLSMTLDLDFQIFTYLANGRASWLGIKVRYDVGPTMGLQCGLVLPWTTAHTKYIGKQWVDAKLSQFLLKGCPFSDQWAKGCCRSLNALIKVYPLQILVFVTTMLR